MLCTANDSVGSIHAALYCPPQHHRSAAPPDSNYAPLQQPPVPSYPNLGLLHDFAYPFAGPHAYHRGIQQRSTAAELVAESVQDNSIHSSSVYGAPVAHPGASGGDSLTQVANSAACKKFWEPGQHLTGSKLANSPDASAGTAVVLKAPAAQRLHGNRPAAHSTSTKKRKRVATMAQRRAANIRERRRMFNLNEAFDKLRRKVPTFAYEKRLSRIETLKLAITYIAFMDEVLRSEKLRGVYSASAGEAPPAPATNSNDNYRSEPW